MLSAGLSSRLLLIAIVLFAVGVFLLMSGVQSVQTAGQKRDRALKENKWAKEPIKVVLVKAKGQTIALGRKEPREDDWLRGLTLTVKNVSPKDIVFVELELHFLRETNSSSDSITAFPITFNRPVTSIDSSTPVLRPGETWETSLADDEYAVLEQLLAKTGYSPGAKDVEIITREVDFTDRTTWIAGETSDDAKKDQALQNDRTPKNMDVSLFRPGPNALESFSLTDALTVEAESETTLSQCGNRTAGISIFCICSPDGTCCEVKQDTVTADPNGQSEIRSVTLPCRNPTTLSTTGCAGQSATANRAVTCASACKNYGMTCSTSSECCSSFVCAIDPWVGGTQKYCIYPENSSECETAGWYWNFQSSVCHDYCAAGSCPYPRTWDYGLCRCIIESPILIDVKGDGFALTSEADGVNFNLDVSGPIEHLAWTVAGSDDAWLVLDRNGNGTIDDGRELFGSFTPQSGPPDDWNGFLALTDYDKPNNGGNADGVITPADSMFSSLRLWQDANHNGISEPNELHALSEFGLKTLELSYKESRKTDQHGNLFMYRAKVKDTNNNQVGRWAWDVVLVSNRQQLQP